MTTSERPTFRAWLSQQTERDDPVGDLARDVAQDKDYRVTTPEGLHRHVTVIAGPLSPALAAVTRAGCEWGATR